MVGRFACSAYFTLFEHSGRFFAVFELTSFSLDVWFSSSFWVHFKISSVVPRSTPWDWFYGSAGR